MDGDGALDPSSASLKVASLSTLDAIGAPFVPTEPCKSSGLISSAALPPASPAKISYVDHFNLPTEEERERYCTACIEDMINPDKAKSVVLFIMWSVRT